MILVRCACLAGLVLLTAFGCDEKTMSARSTSSVEPSTGAAQPKRGKPQPKLPTVKLWIGAHEVVAEVARTPEQIQTGMMWRTNLAEMEGMIFVFPNVDSRSFWMRNCPLPMSCAYIGADGTILETHPMKPFDESSIESKSDKIQFVLEMSAGWFDRNKAGTGMLIRSEKGTLQETFFGRR
jgi:uncharacterized membrane protein (UPF0127 family)